MPELFHLLPLSCRWALSASDMDWTSASYKLSRARKFCEHWDLLSIRWVGLMWLPTFWIYSHWLPDSRCTLSRRWLQLSTRDFLGIFSSWWCCRTNQVRPDTISWGIVDILRRVRWQAWRLLVEDCELGRDSVTWWWLRAATLRAILRWWILAINKDFDWIIELISH